ncbi:polyketide cyclase / dehydrase and lipid transport family protein [Mycobacterium ulcerans str. Harvey]|uniref:Polyketide cyclase / dehydrase and lipid transport family protein n=1 Tax=Mycobacterium ulcerans str. Harvey TaxID=1299332 RepID=A0ABP3AFV3_MYCUL|nr:polyketide cyclase / dehydrase and lipid transport family protein [Mycobacterium ulcerans str. Harvey]
MAATVEIDATPERVYGLITDLRTLASLAEEAVAMELQKGDGVGKGPCSSATTETVAGAGRRPAR